MKPIFPLRMTSYLIRLDDKSWQSIRAQVRWCYTRFDWTPPRKLLKFIDFLPEKPGHWDQYADFITASRRARYAGTIRARRKSKKSMEQRRDYQREYMRNYRQRLQRGSV